MRVKNIFYTYTTRRTRGERSPMQQSSRCTRRVGRTTHTKENRARALTYIYTFSPQTACFFLNIYIVYTLGIIIKKKNYIFCNIKIYKRDALDFEILTWHTLFKVKCKNESSLQKYKQSKLFFQIINSKLSFNFLHL